MDNLLNTYYINYINKEYRPFEPPCIPLNIGKIKSDVINDTYFDIQDMQEAIKQPVGKGSATYKNITNKIIAIIDYEDFIKKLPLNNTKDMKRCDFIVYDLEQYSFFVLNELSQSSSSKNKFSDARQQLHNAIFHFNKVYEIKSFVDKFNEKLCVFSNKNKTLTKTPENIADAFDEVKKYLPEPIEHNYQPITKLNFKLIEAAIIDV